MENFGIFSLISALARQAAGGEEDTRAERADGAAPRQQAVRDEEAERRVPRARNLLERHEAISRRIDRNNR